jgi:uncharacterized protein YjaZ
MDSEQIFLYRRTSMDSHGNTTLDECIVIDGLAGETRASEDAGRHPIREFDPG